MYRIAVWLSECTVIENVQYFVFARLLFGIVDDRSDFD